MSTIVTRAGKGTPLTNDEVDSNFTNLNNDKLEVEANDLTTSVTWANVPNANITEGSVTQHQAALTITESQISDLQSYLTSYTETNNLTTAVTWANVPDNFITQSSVTQHQAALSVTESQISDLQSYLTAETSHTDVLVDGDFTSNGLMKRDGAGVYSVDSSTYATETYVDTAVSNLVDSAPATLDTLNELASALGDDANFSTTVTNSIGTKWTEDSAKISNWDTAYSWDDHSTQGYLTAETNNLLTSVTWADVPDANITQSSVTQHQTALSITESQISDFGTYLTAHQDISGKANLSGADFTGDVSVAGTFNTDNIESTINLVDYPIYSTSLDGSNAIATLGGTSTGNKVHTIEMRPAAGGVRMHWHESGLYGGTPPPSGQTLRFHTTDRGIHVGDDLVGTYTAGDSQNNADTDFGMLVGRNSTNIGSNNFGFGYNINFNSASISSCAGIGSSIYINPTTNNSIGIGGDVFVGTTGTETPAQEGIFAGGNVVTGRGNYSFSWGKGDYEGTTRYAAVNLGKGCVMFGQQINIDADSTWSLVGGTINESSYLKTYAENAHYSIAWGRSVRLDDSNGAVTFGDNNLTTDGHYSAAIGANHYIYAQGAFLGGVSNRAFANASYATAFGTDNRCEGEASFAVGKSNNSLGDSGACIGQGLKTPLFLSNGDYVWDDYSVVVGGYNDEAHKYYTNTFNTAWVEDHRFVVGTGTSSGAKDNGFIVAVPDSGFSGIIMPNLASSPDYASASAAKAGGVPVGGLYRIGSDVKILLSTD